MNSRPETTGPGPDTAGDSLRAHLGLPADAPDSDVETTRDAVASWLDSAPAELDGWVRGQRAALTGEAGRTASATPVVTRRKKSAVMPLAVVGILVGIVMSVYYLGDSGGTPAASGMPPAAAATATPPPLDQARVTELEAKLATDARDIETLRGLAQEYFKAEQFDRAAEYHQKLLAIAPEDMDARLTLGVALFNTGNIPGAEEQWQRAAEIDPASPHPHYNLGFLNLSKNPPDMAKVESEWRKVIELAPDSELAATAQSHLERLATPAPTPTPTR